MADGNIERIIRLLIGVEGAQDAARSVERVAQSADRTEARLNKLGKAAKGLGKAFEFATDASSIFVGMQKGVSEALNGLGFANVQVELANYSRTLLESRAQFAKYDESIVKTERRILMLKDRFAFTRQEVASLQSQFDRGFSFQAPQRMVNVFDVLREVVGENVDAMQRLQSSIQQIGQKVPVYQELFSYGVANRSEQISKNARNMSRALLASAAIAGDISLDELKEQLGAMAQLERSRSGADQASAEARAAQARTQELNDNIRTLNELKVLWEDITMQVAEGLQPYLKAVNNLLQDGGERLKSWVATGLQISRAFAVIGAINIGGSLAKLATGAVTGLGLGGAQQGGPTGIAGRMAGMFGGIGATPTRPMYTIIVGDMTAGGRMSPLLGGPGGRGPAGAAGRAGRLGRLAAGVGRFALPAALVAGGAYAASELVGSQASNSRQLTEGRTFYGDSGMSIGGVDVDDGIGLGATIGGAALAGGAIGSFILPGVGTAGGAAIGAAIGAVVSGLSLLSRQLETTSEAFERSNAAFEDSIRTRMRFAENEAEYTLASLELQKKQLQDAMTLEESEDASLWSGLAGRQGLLGDLGSVFAGEDGRNFLGGIGYAGAEIGELEDMQDELDRINRKINDQKREIEEAEQAQKDQTKEISASDKALIGFVARYQLLNSFIQISNRRFTAAIGKLDTMAKLVSQFRGNAPLGEDFDVGAGIGNALEARQRQMATISTAQQLVSQFTNTINSMDLDLLENEDEFVAAMKQSIQAIPSLGEVISDEIMAQVANIGSAAQIRDTLLSVSDELQTSRLKSMAALEGIFESGLEQFEGEKALRRSAAQLTEARVGLADNLAAGVAASAEMRMDQVRAIQQEIMALNKQLAFAQQVKAEADEMIRQGRALNDRDMITQGLQAQGMAEQKINEIVAERTNMMAKQASITRSIRDGYVDAIAAMSTGAGMFTQIIIDQNKNLGQLQAGTNNRVVSMRSGAFGRGFETSERFTPFGIMSDSRRFGGSDDVNSLITESNPLAQFFRDADVGGEMVDSISDTGAQVVEVWQQEVGRFFSTMGNALRNQPYGPSELQDFITETGGQPATLGNPDVTVEVDAVGRNAGGIIDAARRTGPDRDRVLVAATSGEGIITQQAVAQNGGAGFIDDINSGRLTVAGMEAARASADRKRISDQLDNFSFVGSEGLKERFLRDYPGLWLEKLYKDENFYDLSNSVSDAMNEQRLVTADEYEGLNAHYMKALKRLGNLRYLLPSSGQPQQDITKKFESIEEQYRALMGDRDLVSERMTRLGTNPNPLMFEGPARAEADAFRDSIREQRSELQRSVDEALSFSERTSSLSESPLGVRVPKKILDLARYGGPFRTLSDVENAEQQGSYNEWRDSVRSEFDFFSRKMEARIKAVSKGTDRRRGREQLAGWRTITQDLIRRGMPFIPADSSDVDPNFVGPLQPGQERGPALQLSEEDQARMYREMTEELERRKGIITNRMIAWRQDQANAIMRQLAAADSVQAKTAIVAQLEDFDQNTQSIYEKIDSARYPAQLEELLPQLRALGVRGIGSDTFARPAAAAAADIEAPLSPDNLIGDLGEINEGIFAEANASDNPTDVYLRYMRMPVEVPPKKILERIDEDGKPVYAMEAISDADVNGPYSMRGMMAQRIAEAIAMPTDTNDERFAQFQEFYDIRRYLKQLALGRDSGRVSRNSRMMERESAVDGPARRLQFLSQDGIEIDPAAIQSQKDALSNLLREDSKDDSLEGLFIHNIQAFRALFDQVRPMMANVRASIDENLLAEDLPDYQRWPFDRLEPIVEGSYATGGIAAPRPGGQLARLAEAGKPEAVVPLPDGSSIPVMFQNDSASMSSMPEPIMNSVSTGVNSAIDAPAVGMMGGGSQKVEIEVSGADRRRISDDLVAKFAAMMTRVLSESEQRIMDDMQVRG